MRRDMTAAHDASSSNGSKFVATGVPSAHPRALSPQRHMDVEKLGELQQAQRQAQFQHLMMRSLSPGVMRPFGQPPVSACVQRLQELSPGKPLTTPSADRSGTLAYPSPAAIAGQRVRETSPSFPQQQTSSLNLGPARLREASPDTVHVVKPPSQSVKLLTAASHRLSELSSEMVSLAAVTSCQQPRLTATSPATSAVIRQFSGPMRLREASPDTIPVVMASSPSVSLAKASAQRPCELSSEVLPLASMSSLPQKPTLTATSPVTPAVIRQFSAPLESPPDSIAAVIAPSPAVNLSQVAPQRWGDLSPETASPVAVSSLTHQQHVPATIPVTSAVFQHFSASQSQSSPMQVLSPRSPAAQSSRIITPKASPRQVVRPPWAQLPQLPQHLPPGSTSPPLVGCLNSPAVSSSRPAASPSQPQPRSPSPSATPRAWHSIESKFCGSDQQAPEGQQQAQVASPETIAELSVQHSEITLAHCHSQQQPADLIHKERQERMAEIAALRSELRIDLAQALLNFTHMFHAKQASPVDIKHEAPDPALPTSAVDGAETGTGDSPMDADADAAGGVAEGGVADGAMSDPSSGAPSLEVMMEQLAKSVMEQQRQQHLQAAALREGLMELQQQRDKVAEVCVQCQAISKGLEVESAARCKSVVELAETIRLELGPLKKDLKLVTEENGMRAHVDTAVQKVERQREDLHIALQKAERQREDLHATIEAERSARGRELAEIRAMLSKQRDQEVEPQVAQIFRALAEERTARSRELSELKLHFDSILGAALDHMACMEQRFEEKINGSNNDFVRLAAELKATCHEVQVYAETIAKEQALRTEDVDSIRFEIKELRTLRHGIKMSNESVECVKDGLSQTHRHF